MRNLILTIGLGLAAATSIPASAATYSAKTLLPTSGKLIARDIVWQCGPAACQGSTAESRPVVLCQALAKKAGRVESFVVDGHAFSSADLARCNASAKPTPTQALASQ
jgi:hypothetical protein